MDELDLLEALSEDYGRRFFKSAGARTTLVAGLAGAALGAGLTANELRRRRKSLAEHKKELAAAALKGATISGGASLLHDAVVKQKTSSALRDAYEFGKRTLSNNKREALFAALGAGIGGGMSYAVSKRWGKKPSMTERDAAEKKLSADELYKELKRRGLKPSFHQKLDRAVASSYKTLSKVMSDHPVRSSLPTALGGAALGLQVGALSRRIVE